MGPGALRLRERAVRHIADEHVGELEGAIAGDRRSLDRSDQVALEQPFEQRRHVGAGGEMLECAAPEDPADHGRLLQQALVLRPEQVDPGGDQRLDAVRDPVEGRAVEVRLEQHARRLLQEERVPLGLLDEQRALFFCLAACGGQEERGELVALVVVERSDLDRRRARIPAAPRRARVEQLEPRDADQEQRDRATGARQVLDHLEQALVGPLHVLEDQDERLGVCELLGPAQRRPGDLGVRPDPLGGPEQSERDAEQVGDGIALARDAELLEGLGRRVVVRDPGRGLHHRGDRPVRDPLAVGQRATGEHGRPLDAVRELGDQARLADAGVAEDGHEVGPPVAQRAVVRVLQQLELRLATDERRLAAPLARGEHPFRPPRPDRLARPDLERARILGVDRTGGQPPGAGAERDRPRRRGLLEPRGEHDRFAGHEGRIAVADDDLSRLDAGARLEAELVDRLEHGEGRAHGAFGIVLVRLRHPERRHDGVAGELLHRPPVQRYARRRPLEVAVHAAAHDLRVARGDEPRRVDEVHEEHGRELPFHPVSLGTGRYHAGL